MTTTRNERFLLLFFVVLNIVVVWGYDLYHPFDSEAQLKFKNLFLTWLVITSLFKFLLLVQLEPFAKVAGGLSVYTWLVVSSVSLVILFTELGQIHLGWEVAGEILLAIVWYTAQFIYDFSKTFEKNKKHT